MGCCTDCLLFLISLFFPPLAVCLARGCGCDFLINIGLTLLGWIPGVIHACYIIVKRNEMDGRQPVHVIIQQNP